MCVRERGWSALEIVRVEPESVLLTMLNEALAHLRSDAIFPFSFRAGANERCPVHHEVVEGGFVFGIRCSTHAGIRPRQIEMRQQLRGLESQNGLQRLNGGRIALQLHLAVSQSQQQL